MIFLLPQPVPTVAAVWWRYFALLAVCLTEGGWECRKHSSRVSFDEIPESHRLLEAGHVTGKLVVRVKE